MQRHPRLCFLLLFVSHHFYFPVQLVGGCTLSDLLDKPWSQVSYRLPPGIRAFIFISHRVQSSHYSSIFVECCQLTLWRFPLIFSYSRTSPYQYMVMESDVFTFAPKEYPLRFSLDDKFA